MNKDDLKNIDKSKIGRIEVDREACIGAGPCEALAPKTFQLDEEGKAVVIDTHGDTDQDIIDAAMSCPVMAIKVYDKEGNLIYPA